MRVIWIAVGCVILTSCSLFTNRNSFEGKMPIHLSEKIIGTGRPIVLLHGFGATRQTWLNIQETLSKQHELHLVDLKGFGESPHPNDNDYTIFSQANLVQELIHRTALKDITLVGHSFGGGIALLTALKLEAERPGVLRNLILFDPIAYPQEFPWFIKILRIPILAEVSGALLPNKMQVSMVMKTAFSNPEKISEQILEAYANALNTPGGKMALRETARQLSIKDPEKYISKYADIKVPTLLIWGADDKIVPLTVGKKLNKDIMNSKLIVIDNCGHVPQEECPDKVLPILDNFLPCNGGNL